MEIFIRIRDSCVTLQTSIEISTIFTNNIFCMDVYLNLDSSFFHLLEYIWVIWCFTELYIVLNVDLDISHIEPPFDLVS